MRMGVVTAKLHELAWRGLELTGLDGYMSCLVGPDDCPKAKPDPAPVLLGCELLGLEPCECLYVGDSEVDVETAANCGMDCVCVSWGFRPADFLRSLGPLAVIDRPEDLLALL